ncbi:glycoside hydrolase family protein [Variovorax sp. J2P1-59]|uniref:glycoside hydrolase family protein n=1 Tax=Variovorax flavidus TaxID=3053501 RepID=UPI0025775639|nr:glycoside hydrolase family protein [Variovorax sp. J2P1-59]MDM0074822.1 glycoside hydrolase family protein [Variovorax sp. J2P1-59]
MTSRYRTDDLRRRQVLKLGATSLAAASLVACGGGGQSSAPTSPTTPPATDTPSKGPVSEDPAIAQKSAKRGIAYDLADPQDLAALAPGVSWWYAWGLRPNSGVSADFRLRYGLDFHPMLWNGNFDSSQVESYLTAHPEIQYLLLLNEPNLTDQANLTPAQAAQLWPRYESVASRTGVKLVGPAMTWGTMPGFSDPVVWLDAFYAEFRAANGNRDPRIDFLAFHWYDYGLAAQLDRLNKFGKSFWVTEFANWHNQADGAQIDSVAKQKAQMSDMVATCESRSDVFRYAWFTGRWASDPHFTSLLGASGELTELGRHYLTLPFVG